jgi:hypothetical protein
MANEFVIKNGFHSKGDSNITGSFNVSETGSFGYVAGDGSGLTNISAGALPSGLLSSSAQIAEDISGSFGEASSSFSTRVTTLENTPGGLWTGSGDYISRESDVQITGSLDVTLEVTADALNTLNFVRIGSNQVRFSAPGGIHTADYDLPNAGSTVRILAAYNNSGSQLYQATGSFTGSFFGDGSGLTNLTLPSGILSSSAQIATEISGAFTEASGGLQNRITTLETAPAFDDSHLINTGSGGTQFIEGSLNLSGDIIAQNYIVSSSVTYMTQSFSSGSTVFGDSITDTHAFTGSVSLTGSLSISGDTDIRANDLITLGTDTWISSSNSALALWSTDNGKIKISDTVEVEGQGLLPSTDLGNSIGQAGQRWLRVHAQSFTGSSFTGSFVGDGSGLTGISASHALQADNADTATTASYSLNNLNEVLVNGRNTAGSDININVGDTIHFNEGSNTFISSSGDNLSLRHKDGARVLIGSEIRTDLDLYPVTDNADELGLSTNRWQKVHGVSFTGSSFTGSFVGDGSGLTNISATSLPSGLLSSSAQIATEISGAFTEASSSFSTRVTTLEGQTGGLWTGSGDYIEREGNVVISGSLTVISGSNDEVLLLIDQTQGVHIEVGRTLKPTNNRSTGLGDNTHVFTNLYTEAVRLMDNGDNQGIELQSVGVLGDPGQPTYTYVFPEFTGSSGDMLVISSSIGRTMHHQYVTNPSASFSTRISTLEGQTGGLWTGSGDYISRESDVQVTGSFEASGSGVGRLLTNSSGTAMANVVGDVYVQTVAGGVDYESSADGTHNFTGLRIDGTSLTAGISGSFSGSFVGDGSGLTGIGGAGLWTSSADYISRESDVQITGSLTVSDTVTSVTSSFNDITLASNGTNNPRFYFNGKENGTIYIEVQESGSIEFKSDGSGSLWTIRDTLSGSLFDVVDVSGLPIFEVFSSDRVVAGQFGKETLEVQGLDVTLGSNDTSGSVYIRGGAQLKEQNFTPSTPTGHSILFTSGSNKALYVLDSSGTITDLTAAAGTSFAGLSDTSFAGLAQGDVLYYNGSNWVNLAPGTSGHYLQTQGAGANPQWAAAAGGSSVWYDGTTYISSSVGVQITGSLDVSANTQLEGTLIVEGQTTLRGNTTIGNSLGGDVVDYASKVQSDIRPSATDTYSLGIDSERWRLAASSVTASVVSASSYLGDGSSLTIDITQDTAPRLGGNLEMGGFGLVDNLGTPFLGFIEQGAGVNYFTITQTNAGVAPRITSAHDSVADVGLSLFAKGTGSIFIGQSTNPEVSLVNYTFSASQNPGAAEDGYVLKYSDSTGLISLQAESGGGGGYSRTTVTSSVQTSNTNATLIDTIDTLTNEDIHFVEVYVTGKDTGGSFTDWGAAKRSYVVTVDGSVANIRHENADLDKWSATLGASSVSASVNGVNVEIYVTGTSNTIDWHSAYEIVSNA